MNLLYLILSALIVCAHGYRYRHSKKYHSNLRKQTVKYQWNVMEFDFPTEEDRQEAEASENLIPANAVLTDTQPHYNNEGLLRTFVAVPRFGDGIPYTLATVSNKRGKYGPLLEPYPHYSAHNNRNGTNCNAIISAYHMAITECNQLWVIDDGSGTNCPPQLFLFDLNTDELIHRYRFNPSVYTPGVSSLFNLVVDVRDPPGENGNCQNTMIYIADVSNHGLVVYDFKQNKAWRVESLQMYPDPDHGIHTIAGESFELMGGIFGLATDKEKLYFHPVASLTEYAVPLKVLDNSTLFEDNSNNIFNAVERLGRRKSACPASAMDSNNNLYCVTLNPIELIKWNVTTPYRENCFEKLPIRPRELQFVGGMKVVKNHRGKSELWMASNSYQKAIAGTRNSNEANYRVVVVPLSSKRDFNY